MGVAAKRFPRTAILKLTACWPTARIPTARIPTARLDTNALRKTAGTAPVNA